MTLIVCSDFAPMWVFSITANLVSFNVQSLITRAFADIEMRIGESPNLFSGQTGFNWSAFLVRTGSVSVPMENKVTRQAAILLIDDDPHDVVLVRLAFRKLGVIDPILLVKSGGEAIRYLRGDEAYADRQLYPFPTLILLDLKMPGASGFEVLEWIGMQNWDERPAIVVITGCDDQEDVQRAYKLGADSYLIKPNRFSDLVQMMHSLKQHCLSNGKNNYTSKAWITSR